MSGFRGRAGVGVRVVALLALVAVTASGCSRKQRFAPESIAADRIYFGGPIVTADSRNRIAQAIAIRGGRILEVGSYQTVMSVRGIHTVAVDLKGRALLPGFIDAHGHIAQLAQLGAALNVASPPVGPVEDMAGLQELLRAHIADNDIPPGTWVLGVGYDDALLAEQRHPTRHDLDEVSKEHPIALLHVSLHLATANSAALAEVGVGEDTPDPPSGVFRREKGSQQPNGVMEEHAFYVLFGALPRPTLDQQLDLLDRAQEIYASQGFTTAQDGATGSADWLLLKTAAKEKRLFLDIVAYATWVEMGSVTNDPDHPVGEEHDRLKLGGVKIVLDGSPQGKTAWLSEPYYVPPEGKGDDYVGYPAMSDEQALGFIRVVHEKRWPLLAHANGDEAAEQLLRVAEQVVEEQGSFDWRPVMIHAQMVRKDQLARMVPLGMIPSFFVAHTFYWGDWHRDSVMGPERAAMMSPAQSARRLGLPFTIHNDAPVVPPDSMRLLWTAVNRITRTGQVIGPAERLHPVHAVRAITSDAAFQSFDEDRKGSLEPGKLADMVILSASPVHTRRDAIDEIQVLETIKEGRTIYERPPDSLPSE